MRYLVAYDGSEWSKAALLHAAKLSSHQDATLTILTVAEPTATFSYAGLTGEGIIDWHGESVPELQKQFKEHVETLGSQLLSQAEELVKDLGVKYNLRLEFGSPRLVITEVAEEENTDVIFMGSRGLGAVKRLILGSVSDYTIHHAPCSVYILRIPSDD